MTVSALLRMVIERIVADVEPKAIRTSQSKRDGKITLRVSQEILDLLEQEATKQGLPPSTWAALLIKRRFRDAPQPSLNHRKFIRKAFLQLRGMANNLNQIAKVMNRGVFTGFNYAPSKGELKGIADSVQEARKELSHYAAGQYRFQSLDDEDKSNE
jgi:predicted DNA binding CopG/RHH family protein